jgi:hypothetical protein
VQVLKNAQELLAFYWTRWFITVVGCRYMKRQPLVELFYNIYYSRTVYTDELDFDELKNNNNSSELCNTLNVVLKCNTELQ